jgi:hypothetical protein
MNEATGHKLLWGYLRLAPGLAQISLSTTGLVLLLTVGFHPVTWSVLAAGTAATITSRLLYGGRPDPRLKR